MAKQLSSNKTPASTSATTEKNEIGMLPQEVADLIERSKCLLQEQDIEQALDILTRTRLKSPWITNAMGVCLLRLGKVEQASEVFKGLAAASGIYLLKHDAPIAFKTNYATALLASYNVEGCLQALNEIGQQENQEARTLRKVIRQWRRSLPLWQKIKWYAGEYPRQGAPLDFPLGVLE